MDRVFSRYESLRRYVGWTEDDARRVVRARAVVAPHFKAIVDDFYSEIEKHPETRRVIIGGAIQVSRLKRTLLDWLEQLFSGVYDEAYVTRRWQVGWRHVEIGLDQIYVNVALARIRTGVTRALSEGWTGRSGELTNVVQSMHRLLDLELALVSDAYHQEQAQKEKQRSEAVFRNLVEAAGCVIVILRPNARVAYFNPFAEELTGFTANEVIGQSWFDIFISAADRPRVEQAFRDVLAGTMVRNFQNAILRRDGTRARLLWNSCRLDQYGDEPAVLGVAQDITSLQEAQETALRSERLAAIGQMVAGLAHESRNALQRSQACLEMLEYEITGQSEALDLVRRIQRAQDHLHKMFEEVRGYVAPINLDRNDCLLSEVWREAWELLTAQRRGREVVLNERTSRVDLHCAIDRFRMVQVFRNLLENSLAACHDPVEIEIAAFQTRLSDRDAVKIAVRDNGPGLNPEQRERIFQPFYTTKTQGTGLGMAIAQRIVEAHGGTLAVGDEWVSGAELVVTLPRVSP